MKTYDRTPRKRKGTRKGFTLIELLVVISIIATLVALITPAVQNARNAARRTECINNLKNVAMAAMNYASANRGQLPYLAGMYPAGVNQNAVVRSWVVQLLPHLDASDVFRAIQSNQLSTPPSLKILQCPVDTNNFEQQGGLSYVANAGYMDRAKTDWWKTRYAITEATLNTPKQKKYSAFSVDWDDDSKLTQTDARIAHAAGLFWLPVLGDRFRTTLEYISGGDGQTNTLMFSENLQAQDWHLGAAVQDFAFGLGTENNSTGPAGVGVGSKSTNQLRLYGPNQGQPPNFGISYINQRKDTSTPGTAPRPSSNHAGQVMVAFSDGRARPMNEAIDQGVYARLITPDGQRMGQELIIDSY